jgi:hypothetical protein
MLQIRRKQDEGDPSEVGCTVGCFLWVVIRRGNSGNEQSWQVVDDFSGAIEVDGDAAAEVASDCVEGREMGDEKWRKEGRLCRK